MTLEDEAPPSEGNFFTREGSAAHKLSEMRLSGELTAVQLTACKGLPMHDIVRADDPERETFDYLDIVVDEEMINCVQEFLVWINEQIPTGYTIQDKGVIGSEVKVVSDIDPEIRGTVDVLICDWPDVLHIIDLKYGKGNQIDVENNIQLIIYALCAVALHGDDFDTVRMTIYQPRGEGPTVKTWEMPMAKFVKKWAKKIAKAHQDCLEKPNLFRPGSWCKYCRGVSECGRAKRETNKMAKPTAVVPADVKSLSRILKLECAVLEYLNSCKKAAFGHLSRGEKVPGFKLVKTWGREKWIDEPSAINALQGCDEPVISRKLKTPKQVRKILGDEYPLELDKLTVTPENGLKLVPETDKRGAYLGAQQEFSNVSID